MPLEKNFFSRIVQSPPQQNAEYTPDGRLYRSDANGPGLNIQRINYNEIEFPVIYRTSATIEPQYSEDKKRNTATKITIEVETVFVDQTLTAEERSMGDTIPTTDVDMETIRARLGTNGAVLVFSLQGLGLVRIASSKFQLDGYTILDLDRGPKTTIVNWEPITPLAAKVTWKVETLVSPCIGEDANFLDLSCSIATTIDKRGITTRTITGKLKVPVLVNTTDTLTADEAEAVDNLLPELFPPLNRFNREYSKTLSPDGGTLDFTITDTELESNSPYFPGVAEMDVTLSTNSGWGKQGDSATNFGTWQCSLNGSIDMINGVSKLFGFLAALSLIDYYLEKGFKGLMPVAPGETASTGNGRSRALLTDLKFTDNVYSRRMSFSAGWILITDFSTLIQSTGLFQPVLLNVEGTPANFRRLIYNDGSSEAGVPAEGAPISFERWQASVDHAQNPRGIHTDLVWQHKDFPTIALCGGSVTGLNDQQPTEQNNEPTVEDVPEAKPVLEKPADDEGYVPGGGGISMEVREHTNVYQSHPFRDGSIIQENSANGPWFNPSPPPFDPTTALADQQTGGVNTPRYIARRVGKSMYEVIISGVLMRVGAYPAIPAVATIGDKRIVKAGTDMVKSTVVGAGSRSASGPTVPIIATAFRKKYLVEAEGSDNIPDNFQIKDINQNDILHSGLIG